LKRKDFCFLKLSSILMRKKNDTTCIFQLLEVYEITKYFLMIARKNCLLRLIILFSIVEILPFSLYFEHGFVLILSSLSMMMIRCQTQHQYNRNPFINWMYQAINQCSCFQKRITMFSSRSLTYLWCFIIDNFCRCFVSWY
jgi:hypothetical protein